MASSISVASPILLVILFHLLSGADHTCFASNSTQKTPTGHRFTLTRVNFGKRIPKNQHALNSFSDNAMNVGENLPISSITARVTPHEDDYVMELTSGTPPLKFSNAIMDTGSDLIWTKCKRNITSQPLSNPIQDCDKFPFQLPAVCEQSYADGKSTIVTMMEESLTFGDGNIHNVTFGCEITISNEDSWPFDGVVGMGRGKLSLVSQLNESVFSYCLSSSSEKSIMLTGSYATTSMGNTNDIQTTPFQQGVDHSYYYISLEGISVGETRLSLSKSDFAIEKTGGMIIDSGTTFTYLEEDIINRIENEFMNQTKLKIAEDTYMPLYTGLDRCFNSTYDVKIIPKLVFHFSGADWDLPPENYIYSKEGKSCLAFIANDKNDNHKVSIFGNMQQQNMMVLYDLDNNSLSFKPANCNL